MDRVPKDAHWSLLLKFNCRQLQGEIRGGAWVVVDRNINPDCIEFYADNDARGGILEAPGICEVKFRAKDQIALMHRLDPTLQV